MELLLCQGITKRFGGVMALDHVSLAIEEGETVGIIGTNGAGKSTLFHILTGFLKADAGRVLLRTSQGMRSIGGKRPHLLAKLGVCRTFQSTRLFEEYTLLQNITLMEQRAGEGKQLLAQAGLLPSADQLPVYLTCYEARVAELLRAVAAGGRLIFLDEPAAGMNREETERFHVLLEKLRDRYGFTAVLIEHDMELIEALCGKVFVMDSGRVIARGGYSQVMRDPEVRKVLIGEEMGRKG